jgi:hypothetical protein
MVRANRSRNVPDMPFTFLMITLRMPRVFRLEKFGVICNAPVGPIAHNAKAL